MREQKGIKFAQGLSFTAESTKKSITPATNPVDQLFVPADQDPVQNINSDSEVEESELEDSQETEFEKYLFLRGLELQRIKRTNYSLLGAIADQIYSDQTLISQVRQDYQKHLNLILSASEQALVNDTNFGNRLSENGSFDLATLTDMYKRPIEIYEFEEITVALGDARGDTHETSVEPIIIKPKNVDKKVVPEPIRLSAHPGGYFHSIRSPSTMSRHSTNTGRKVRISSKVLPDPEDDREDLTKQIRETFVLGQMSMKSLPGDSDGSYNSSVDSSLQVVPKIEAPLNSNDGLQINVTFDAASNTDLSSHALDPSQVSSVRSSVSTLSGLGGIGAKIAMKNFHSPAVGRKTIAQPVLSNASSSQWTSDEASSSKDNSNDYLSTTHSMEPGPAPSSNTNRRMSLEVPKWFKRH